MEEKKATRKELFERIIETMENDAEVVEMCNKYIAQLSKKREPKVNTAAIEFAAGVVTYMSDYGMPEGFDGFTNKELAEHFEVSSQKMSAALRRLVEEGAVKRIEGEKKSAPAKFVLAAA